MTLEDEATAREITLKDLILNKRQMAATGKMREVKMFHIDEKDKEKTSAPSVKDAVQVQGNLTLRSIAMKINRITSIERAFRGVTVA